MGRLTHTFLLVTLTLFSLVCAALEECADTSQADFDYVVVGAGAGGGPLAARLAESGFSVLVVEAGHDVFNLNTTLPVYFGRASEDPQLELNYTLDEYPPGFKIQKNDMWYPRARGVGGSTLHNALINIVAGTQNDFDNLSTTFNDPTWSHTNMQEYFKRIENNTYLIPALNPDHGFDGWLQTSLNPVLDLLDIRLLDLQVVDIFATLALAGPPILDHNSLGDVNAIGASAPSFTMTSDGNRSCVHDRLDTVKQTSGGRLQFSLDTIATKVLMCNSTSGVPTAFGVEIAPGAALPVASNFNGKTDLQTRNITVKHEVIVSAGSFQSPQLLMLSGIGDTAHLSEFGIDTIVNLPGVGQNLQDHDEISTIWQLKQNYSLFNGCTFLSDPAKDPCLAFWESSGHRNLYSLGSAFEAIISQSSPNLPEPDILTYWSPAYFPGFVRGFSQGLADHHNSLTAIVLKGHASSKGTVRLTGSHPQDTLNIQKQHFQAAGGPQDIVDLREAIKRARALVKDSPISLFVEEEVFPGPQAQTDDEIDNHVLQNVFGHHACCTNAIGPESDPDAVLDGDFRVHGVNNLRVVDASSWPHVPGWFITTLTYMISEKAADVIIAAAKQSP